MTIAAGKTPFHSYAPGSAMSAEAIPFEFLDAADLAVEDSNGTTLTEGVDFTIGGNGRTGTGTITALVDAGSATWKIWSATPDQQQIDLAETRKVPLTQYEKELDRAAIRARENAFDIGRAPKVPRGESISALPTLAQRKGSLLGAAAAITYSAYDADGNPTIDTPDNFAAPALAAATDAREFASFAEEFSGPAYASQAAGEAATSEGQFFRVPNGTTPETYTRYQRTAGGSIEAAGLATTVDLASSDPAKGSALINHRGTLVSDLMEGSRQRAYLSDQFGSTAYDRMQFALEAASRVEGGGDVFGDASQLVSLSSGQVIQGHSRVEVFGNGMQIDVDATIDRPVRAESGGNNIGFRDLIIDCKGNNDSAGLSAEGVHDFYAENVEVKRFVDYAIDVYSDVDGKRAAKNARVERCYVHTPDPAVAFAIVVRSVNGGPFVDGAKILRNTAIGCDPNNRPAQPLAYGAGGTADQIVAQGVHNFDFSDNRSLWSGAAGVSLSRGCKNGIVKGNVIERTHESFNFGSGIEFVRVPETSGFVVGMNGDQNGSGGGDIARRVSSTTSGVSATEVSQGWLTSIRPDSGAILNSFGQTGASGPGWLGIASPSGGLFTIGETIVQGAIASQPIIDVLYAAQDLQVIDNRLFETGIKNGDPGDPQYSSIYGVLNFIRTRGFNPVVNNKYYDRAGIGRATALVANSNSLLGVGENYWNGEVAREGRYSLASPAGEWAWTAFPAGGELVAAGRFGANGALSNNTGTNISGDADNPGNGQYSITLANPVTDHLKVFIDVTAITTDGQVSAQMTDASTIEVRTRTSAGALSNKAFSIEIREP